MRHPVPHRLHWHQTLRAILLPPHFSIPKIHPLLNRRWDHFNRLVHRLHLPRVLQLPAIPILVRQNDQRRPLYRLENDILCNHHAPRYCHQRCFTRPASILALAAPNGNCQEIGCDWNFHSRQFVSLLSPTLSNPLSDLERSLTIFLQCHGRQYCAHPSRHPPQLHRR